MRLETLNVEVIEKVDGFRKLTEHMNSIELLIQQTTQIRDNLKSQKKELERKIIQSDNQIIDLKYELAIIKANWKIIARSRDPLLKIKMITRRFHIPCRVCGEKVGSKKDLKVHLTEKHSY